MAKEFLLLEHQLPNLATNYQNKRYDSDHHEGIA